MMNQHRRAIAFFQICLAVASLSFPRHCCYCLFENDGQQARCCDSGESVCGDCRSVSFHSQEESAAGPTGVHSKSSEHPLDCPYCQWRSTTYASGVIADSTVRPHSDLKFWAFVRLELRFDFKRRTSHDIHDALALVSSHLSGPLYLRI